MVSDIDNDESLKSKQSSRFSWTIAAPRVDSHKAIYLLLTNYDF